MLLTSSAYSLAFSLGSYGGTLSLSRSCTIDTHYPKSFSSEREKMEVLLMPVAEEADECTVRYEVFSFNMDANSSAESFDKLRSRTRLFHSF